MNEFVYKDYLPANARIIIDYSAKKPEDRVKFAYPKRYTYSEALWENAVPAFVRFWAMIHGLLLLYFFAFVVFPFALGFGSSLIILNWSAVSERTMAEIDSPSLVSIGILAGIMAILLMGIYFIVIPVVIATSMKKETMARWMPKIGFWTEMINDGLCFKRFSYKDVHKRTCIIPAFSNIYLQYEATKDFSAYLQKIRIIEYPIKFLSSKKNSLFNLFKKNKQIDFEESVNEWNFQASFHFKKQPKTGDLKVIFA